jgi:hypothetical protein
LDVLLVINHINAQTAGGGEGEPPLQPTHMVPLAVGESEERVIPASQGLQPDSARVPAASFGSRFGLTRNPTVPPLRAASSSPAARALSWAKSQEPGDELDTVLDDIAADILQARFAQSSVHPR